ncbi:Protein of unknown function [Bacillus wiedmannii]|nr:Protein of unknown function [Bacillus wiedmannii]
MSALIVSIPLKKQFME